MLLVCKGLYCTQEPLNCDKEHAWQFSFVVLKVIKAEKCTFSIEG